MTRAKGRRQSRTTADDLDAMTLRLIEWTETAMNTIKLRDVIDGKTVVTETHDPTCTGCEHDCPWRRHTLGPPFCPVCDDHAEAVHAGYGDVPCDCGDKHDQ